MKLSQILLSEGVLKRASAPFRGLRAAKIYLAKQFKQNPTAVVIKVRLRNFKTRARVTEKLWPGGDPVTKSYYLQPKENVTLDGLFFGVSYMHTKLEEQVTELFDEETQLWTMLESTPAERVLGLATEITQAEEEEPYLDTGFLSPEAQYEMERLASDRKASPAAIVYKDDQVIAIQDSILRRMVTPEGLVVMRYRDEDDLPKWIYEAGLRKIMEGGVPVATNPSARRFGGPWAGGRPAWEQVGQILLKVLSSPVPVKFFLGAELLSTGKAKMIPPYRALFEEDPLEEPPGMGEPDDRWEKSLLKRDEYGP